MGKSVCDSSRLFAKDYCCIHYQMCSLQPLLQFSSHFWNSPDIHFLNANWNPESWKIAWVKGSDRITLNDRICCYNAYSFSLSLHFLPLHIICPSAFSLNGQLDNCVLNSLSHCLASWIHALFSKFILKSILALVFLQYPQQCGSDREWLRGFQRCGHEKIAVIPIHMSNTAANVLQVKMVFSCWIYFRLEMGTWIMRKLLFNVIYAAAFKKPVTERRNDIKSMDFSLAYS